MECARISVILPYRLIKTPSGGKSLSYRVRLMCQGDIAQVTEIDREAFLTMTPSTSFQRELRSPLSYYIVVCHEKRIVDQSGIKEAAPGRPYIAGFAGFWIMAGEAHIVNLAVRQSYRRQGSLLLPVKGSWLSICK